MFSCERCRTRFTNGDARTLEYCPLCQEEGEQVPLALKLFVGPLTEHVERTRMAARELGGRPKLPAPAGRSTDTSEGNGASA